MAITSWRVFEGLSKMRARLFHLIHEDEIVSHIQIKDLRYGSNRRKYEQRHLDTRGIA